MIKTICEPRNVIKKEDFIRDYPGYSVALDGLVYGEPFFESTKRGPYKNFNHHEEVDRMGTRSTCSQVYIALKQQFIQKYTKENEVIINIYYNDPDQDTLLADWLLHNHEQITKKNGNYLINRLADMEDKLDVTLGTYLLDLENQEIYNTIKKMAWVFEPYTKSRIDGKIDTTDYTLLKKNMEDIRLEVHRRITAHVNKSENAIDIDRRYNIIDKGKKWIMIKEIGTHARINIFDDNKIDTFISYRKRENNKYVYSIIFTPYSEFPRERFCNMLNNIENTTKIDGWSGGSSNISSSRKMGSNIDPKELAELLKKTYDRKE